MFVLKNTQPWYHCYEANKHINLFLFSCLFYCTIEQKNLTDEALKGNTLL